MEPLVPPLPIAQSEIEFLIKMDSQITALGMLRSDKYRQILQRLTSGSGVEPGRHAVRIRRSGRANLLAVNGASLSP